MLHSKDTESACTVLCKWSLFTPVSKTHSNIIAVKDNICFVAIATLFVTGSNICNRTWVNRSKRMREEQWRCLLLYLRLLLWWNVQGCSRHWSILWLLSSLYCQPFFGIPRNIFLFERSQRFSYIDSQIIDPPISQSASHISYTAHLWHCLIFIWK